MRAGQSLSFRGHTPVTCSFQPGAAFQTYHSAISWGPIIQKHEPVIDIPDSNQTEHTQNLRVYSHVVKGNGRMG